MRIVRPAVIDEDNLLLTNVAIDDAPMWVSGSTVALGDQRIYDLVVYEALFAGNVGTSPPNTPTASAPRWSVIGPVNAWKMFTKKVGNRWLPGLYTENPDVIDFTVRPAGIVNSVGLVGVSAAEVQIIMTSPGGEVVYDETYDMTAREPVTNWYQHWFNEFTRRTSVVDLMLPAYGNSTIRVIASAPGATVKIGTFVVGSMRKIGDTLIGSGFNFKSRSSVDEDPILGTVEILSRGSRRSNNFRVSVPREMTDAAVDLLDRIRDTPTMYIGDESMDSTIIVGWLRDSPGTFENIAKTLINIDVWRL